MDKKKMASLVCSNFGEAPRQNTPLLKCGRCLKVQYHDKNCQKQHYKQHTHVCRQMAQEDLSGVKVVIEDDEKERSFGRVVLATRDFQAGQMIMAERPCCVIDEDLGFPQAIWLSFLALDEDKQQELIDMYRPNQSAMEPARMSFVLEEWRAFERGRPAEIREKNLDQATAINLLLIDDANGHTLSNTGEENCNVHPSLANNLYPKNAHALFTIGSKFEHSCAPTVSSHITPLGLLHYTAQVPIKAGDRLCTTYIGGAVYEMCRQERRDLLLESKYFICKCKRCRGVDDCLPLTCRACPNGIVYQLDNDNVTIWQCVICGWVGSQASFDLRQQISQQNELMKEHRSFASNLDRPDALKKLESLETEIFHPLNYCHQFLGRTHEEANASIPSLMIQERGLSPHSPVVLQLVKSMAFARLRRLVWTKTHLSIMYGLITIKEAVQRLPLCMNDSMGLDVIDLDVIEGQIRSILDEATNGTNLPSLPVIPLIPVAYQAGLDLLAANKRDSAVRLFSTYLNVFQRDQALKDRIDIESIGGLT